jgi:hypothetical protein
MPTTKREKTLSPSFPFLPLFPFSLDSLVLLQTAELLPKFRISVEKGPVITARFLWDEGGRLGQGSARVAVNTISNQTP